MSRAMYTLVKLKYTWSHSVDVQVHDRMATSEVPNIRKKRE
jgi:hypothetical protein